MAEPEGPLSQRPQRHSCGGKDHLSKCAGCRVVWYCGREHQIADWNAKHKTRCTEVKKTLWRLQYEETKLREAPGDAMFQANPFENSVGHFWGIYPTRDFMAARFAHVEGLLKINTFEAVRVSLEHLEDTLRLCRGDNQGVRALMPALYLRLGRDQDCYGKYQDFIKWWIVVSEESSYDFGNMDLPYLDLHGADPFEPMEKCKPQYQLSMLVSLTLVKIRLLLDLQSLENAVAVGEKIPQEILDSVREQMISPVIAWNEHLLKEVTNGRPLAPYITNLQSQVRELYNHGKSENKHMWPALLSPGDHLTARPQYTSFGGVEEMQMALQYNYRAWVETPGALDMIKTLAAKDGGR